MTRKLIRNNPVKDITYFLPGEEVIKVASQPFIFSVMLLPVYGMQAKLNHETQSCERPARQINSQSELSGIPYIHTVKRGNEHSLKSALAEWSRALHLDEKLNEKKLRARWEELFGKAIASYTRQIRVRNHKLYLTIDSAPLRHELQYGKQQLMDRINAEIAEGMILDVVMS